jgi:hypothetical protein
MTYYTTHSPVMHRGKWALWIRDANGDAFRVYGQTIQEAERRCEWLLSQLNPTPATREPQTDPKEGAHEN